MIKIWVDAQISPAIAVWINNQFENFEAKSLSALGLRDARDIEIYNRASIEDVIIMTKDSDFQRLVQNYGSPPKIILITCGNTSNERLRTILSFSLNQAVNLLNQKETIVEIKDK